MMNINKFLPNVCLRDTIACDPNLSDEAKELFILVCEDWERERTVSKTLEQFADLIRRNYIQIEGFPTSVPTPGSVRTAKQNRLRGLKMFITGRE